MAKDNMSEEDQIKALEDLGFVIEDEEQDAGVDEKSLEDLGFVIEDEDAVAQAEEPTDVISTQMYSGMDINQARERYDQLMESKDVTPAPFGVGQADGNTFQDLKLTCLGPQAKPSLKPYKLRFLRMLPLKMPSMSSSIRTPE